MDCAVWSSARFGASAAGTRGDGVRGDASFAEVHVHGCRGSGPLRTEPVGGGDWTGRGPGLTSLFVREEMCVCVVFFFFPEGGINTTRTQESAHGTTRSFVF